MNDQTTILLVEDEPMILMDLEFAAEDRGIETVCSGCVDGALSLIDAASPAVDVAVLDVSLLDGEDCLPIAQELDRRDIPYIIHSGDLDRADEKIRALDAPFLAKPCPSDKVIAAAIVELNKSDASDLPLAAE